MQHTQAFIGLGGNIGDSRTALKLALEQILTLDGIRNLKASPFYDTTPVSSIPQTNYTNAVCICETTYTPIELFRHLQKIETTLGNKPKIKDAPRYIDLDILFFGQAWVDVNGLKIPHPRWKERLFVLQPLSDLIDKIWVPTGPGRESYFDLHALLKKFTNPHHETVNRI